MEIDKFPPEIKAALGLDGNNEAITVISNEEKEASIFRVNIAPRHPGLGTEFIAERYIYASLTPDSHSLLGYRKRPDGFPEDQISIILPKRLPPGEYPFKNSDMDFPHAYAGHYPNGYSARSGFIKFTRDDANQRIEATFEFSIKTDELDYELKGKLYLDATGSFE